MSVMQTGVLPAMANLAMVEIANAANHAPLVTGPDLQMPSIWRVLFAFLLTGAAAFTVALLLRRLKPWLKANGVVRSSSNILLVAHRKLERSLSVYVVDIEKQRFVITHSPHSTVVSRIGTSETEQSASAPDMQNLQ
ncbi:MAG: hypothetical protein ABUS47_03650 [Steroidobacter sp.]